MKFSIKDFFSKCDQIQKTLFFVQCLGSSSALRLSKLGLSSSVIEVFWNLQHIHDEAIL